MMRSLLSPIVLLAAVSSLSAADPWKSKPIQNWTREETVQFLRESPWVRKLVTSGEGARGGGQPVFSSSVFSGASQGCLSCAKVEAQAEQPRAGGLGGSSGAAATTYHIQWSSSRIVRQSLAHLLALQGRGNENPSPPPLEVFAVSVGGADMQAFEGIEEPQLLKDAWIRPRKSNTKVPASRATILRGHNERISVVYYEFPRQQDGQPILEDEEKKVEFNCRCRDKTLQAEFELNKMMFEGNRDL